ncbi:MAG: tetratricopeptide repeat protein [Terriglobales bacterium]
MRLARGRPFAAVVGMAAVLCAVRAPGQSDSLAAQSQQAHALMAAGQFDRAVPIYQRLAQALPGNAGLALDLGLALHMAGREGDAVKALRRSLELDGSSIPARLYLADAYLSLGQEAPALPLLQSVLKAAPENAHARKDLAAALLDLGRPGAAAGEYRQLTAGGSGGPQAWYGLGRSYAALAQQAFDRLRRTAPGSAFWLALAADSRAKAGQLSGAFYLYRQALAKMPSLAGAHAALASIYHQSGHPDWAAIEEARERALPPPACAQQPLACEYRAARYDRIVAAKATTPAGLYWRSRAANRLALAAFAHLADFPDSAEHHELLATLHANALDYKQAAAEWQQAYELSGHDPAIGAQLATSWMELHDFAAAEPLLEGLRRRHPGAAQFDFLLGYLRLQQQQPKRAIPLLEASLHADPRRAEGQRALAEAYLETGAPNRAIPHLLAALPEDDDGSLHYQLARAYQADGEPERAAAALREYQRLHQSAEAAKQAAQSQLRISPPRS